MPPASVNQRLAGRLCVHRSDVDRDELAASAARVGDPITMDGLGESRLATLRDAGGSAFLPTSTPTLDEPLVEALLSRRLDIPFQQSERLLDQLTKRKSRRVPQGDEPRLGLEGAMHGDGWVGGFVT